MIHFPALPESSAHLIRQVLQEEAERVAARAVQLEELIPRAEQRLQDLRAEGEEVRHRLEQLVGDESVNRPGLVHLLNEQLNLFGGELGPRPSASLGRRGHPAPIAAVAR